MKNISISKKNIIVCLTIFIIFALLCECRVKLIADYDATVAEAIIKLAKDVDTFYAQLLETPGDKRDYNEFADKYLAIEVELRSLIIRNKVRPLNKESIGIAENTLELWLKYKNKHKEVNIYKDALAKQHRNRFDKLFTAMAVAEEAKRLSAEDR